MDWLTGDDWTTLASFAGVGLVGVLLALGVQALLRWRRGEAVWGKQDWLKHLGNLAFFGGIMLAIPVSEIFERRTGNGLIGFGVTFAVMMAFLLPALWLGKRRMNRLAAESGRENPAAAPVPKVPFSGEEKRVHAWVIGILLLGVLAFCGLATMAAFWALEPLREGAAPSQNRLLLMILTMVGLLAAFTYPLIGRWPGRVASRNSVEIAASPDRIWSTIIYRPGYTDWKGIYSSVEPLSGPGEAYGLHYYNLDTCIECGLPRRPEDSVMSQRVEVLEALRPRLYRLRSFGKGSDGIKGNASTWLDHELTSYAIEPLPGGASRVTLECIAERPKVWMALLIKLGGPVKQELFTLKSYLEGTATETLYSVSVQRLEAARRAPRHCGCAARKAGLATT